MKTKLKFFGLLSAISTIVACGVPGPPLPPLPEKDELPIPSQITDEEKVSVSPPVTAPSATPQPSRRPQGSQ